MKIFFDFCYLHVFVGVGPPRGPLT